MAFIVKDSIFDSGRFNLKHVTERPPTEKGEGGNQDSGTVPGK